MAVPYTFSDCIRTHDRAVFDWLRRQKVHYPDVKNEAGAVLVAGQKDFPILCVMASPSRAYAAFVNLLVALKWVGSDAASILRQRAKDNIAVLPLPAISFQRSPPSPDTELSNVPLTFRRGYFNQATNQWEDHPWPMHMRTNYTVTVWSVKRFTEAFLFEALFSEFGKLGALQSEVLIPVEHPLPWGTISQSMKLESAPSDLTELEGDEARYLRHEYTLSLRTWLFRAASTSADEVQRIQEDFDVTLPVDTLSTDVDEADTTVQYFSENLFRIPGGDDPLIRYWPLSGDVETTLVAPATEDGFDVTLTTRSDQVSFLDRQLNLDSNANTLVQIVFEYRATDRFELVVGFRDPTVNAVSSAYSEVFESTPVVLRVQRFVLIKGSTTVGALTVRVAGMNVSSGAEIELRKVRVRHISTLTMVAPTSTIAGGGKVRYGWTGLNAEPYLIVLEITTTTGGLNVVTAYDDDPFPEQQESQTVDSFVNVGAVFSLVPKNGTLALDVPDTVAVVNVYVQRYRGYYNRNDV